MARPAVSAKAGMALCSFRDSKVNKVIALGGSVGY